MIRKPSTTTLIVFVAVTTLLLLVAYPLLAQSFQGAGAIQNLASEGRNIGKYIVDAIFVFSGIVGSICLIPAGIKYFRGESQSKDSITSIGIGLITIFIILSMIKAIHGFS